MRRLLLLVPLIVSCSSASPKEAKQTGELGGYVFAYRCHNPSDAFCDDGATFAKDSLPIVAVGSTFRISYNYADGKDAQGNKIPDNYVGSFGSGDRLEQVGSTSGTETNQYVLRAKKPGFAALLASIPASGQVSSGVVGDLLHLKIAKADHIEASGKITGAAGASFTASAGGLTVGLSAATGVVTLRAFVTLADKTPLAGALPTAWTQTLTDVLKLTSDGSDNVASFDVRSFGTAVVHVVMGDVAADITVKLEAK